MFLLKIFNFIMFSFCFGKLIKISENVSALQSYFLLKNIDEDSVLLQYPN